jgi:hypothetical protein
MGGSGVFVVLLLILSLLILVIWLVKGSGRIKQKAKLTTAYFSVSLIPSLFLSYLFQKFDLSILVSNISFVFLTVAVLSGFIIPLIASRIFKGSNEHRI